MFQSKIIQMLINVTFRPVGNIVHLILNKKKKIWPIKTNKFSFIPMASIILHWSRFQESDYPKRDEKLSRGNAR